MARSRLMHLILCCLVVAAGVAGCSTDTTTSGESTGSLDLSLELAPGVVINEVEWVISRPGMADMEGTIDTSAPGATASVEVFGLPPGDGYTVTLTAMVEVEDDEEPWEPCIGSKDFSVTVGDRTTLMVMLNCKRPERLGGVRVNGKFNVCADLAKVIVSPLETSIGNQIDLYALGVDVDDNAEDIQYLWSATTGIIAEPGMRETTYTCTEVIEVETITIRISDDWDFCMDEYPVKVKCVEGDGGNLCDDAPACNPTENECTVNECNPANGQCEISDRDGEDCDDGEGMCVGDSCDPKDLCIDQPPCPDTDCKDGVCVPATGDCVFKPINEGEDCDDATGICNAEGMCIPKATCEDELCPETGEDCTVSKCNILLDKCVEMNVPDNTDCLVGDVDGKCSDGKCIVSDLCPAEKCLGGVCEEDGTCEPADGTCTPGGNSPEGADCIIGGIVCDGDGNCVACNEPNDCTEDPGQCFMKTCIGNACGKVPGNEGDPCDLEGIGDGRCMAGDCVEPPECDDLNPCADDPNDCITVACIAGSCVSGDAAERDPCQGEGNETLCDGNGMCVECLNPITDCPDGPDKCTVATCDGGNMCGTESASMITMCDLDGVDDGVCDGEGTCGECNNDPQCPGQVCISNMCMDDNPPVKSLAMDVACTNSVTDDVSMLAWTLITSPTGPIINTEEVTTIFTGSAQFDETFLDAAQSVAGAITKAALIEVNANVLPRTGLADCDGTCGGGASTDASLGVLLNGEVPWTCAQFESSSGVPGFCDPANDVPPPSPACDNKGVCGNTDCTFNFGNPSSGDTCRRFVTIPTSSDCSVNGPCDTEDLFLGGNKLATQCAPNQFCVTGALDVPLSTETGNYLANNTAGARNDGAPAPFNVLYGWDDVNNPTTCPDGSLVGSTAQTCDCGVVTCTTHSVICTDTTAPAGFPTKACEGDAGTYALPASTSFVPAQPTPPVGLRVNAGGLGVGLDCLFAVAGGLDTDDEPDGIPDQSIPTPEACAQVNVDNGTKCDVGDPLLIEYNIQ